MIKLSDYIAKRLKEFHKVEHFFMVTGVGVLWGYGSDKTKLIENSDFVIEEINKWNALVEIK